MGSFQDPARTFAPLEVLERLLEIIEDGGYRPSLYISSDDDVATYLDTFGFDVYSLDADTAKAFDAKLRRSPVLPNGSRSHDSITSH